MKLGIVAFIAVALRLLLACGSGCVVTSSTNTSVVENCAGHIYAVNCGESNLCDDCSCREDGETVRTVGAFFCVDLLDACGFPS